MLQDNSKLLVFPSDCELDEEAFLLLERTGAIVIGASSTSDASFLNKPACWLPYVTEASYLMELEKLIIEEGLTHVYTSHAGVWGVLSNNIGNRGACLPIELCSDFPFDVVWNRFSRFGLWAEKYIDCHKANDSHLSLSDEQLTALCMQYNNIPGQSDNYKLESLIDLAPRVPKGDWIEIGALYGRSSFALGWLANYFCDENLVCVDPWDSFVVKPQKGKAAVMDQQSGLIDTSKIFTIFKSSIALLSNTSYIQSLSEDALAQYLASDLDGRSLKLQHEIAFLHIDGNHHFDEVSKDVALWEPYVRIGGWVAIDDYLWAFGDGPKKAGDLLLASNRFDTAFVAGDTLYMQKSKLG